MNSIQFHPGTEQLTAWEGEGGSIASLAGAVPAPLRAPDGSSALVLALQLADQRKNDFLATLAHELRTPLSSIRCANQLISATTDRDLLLQAVAAVDRSVGQMTRLIGDLLDIPAIVAGRLELRLERVDLVVILESALSQVKQEFSSRKHRLAVHLPASSVWLRADAVRLQQVFVNLLSNAARYTSDRGDIVLTAEVLAGSARVTICDTGIGIAADDLPRLFELFYRADAKGRSHRQGYGIGLAVVGKLVEAHGGTVAVTSAGRNLGCEFSVTLPLQGS